MLPGTSHILRSWFYPSREAFYLAWEYSHFSLLAGYSNEKVVTTCTVQLTLYLNKYSLTSLSRDIITALLDWSFQYQTILSPYSFNSRGGEFRKSWTRRTPSTQKVWFRILMKKLCHHTKRVYHTLISTSALDTPFKSQKLPYIYF